MTSPNPACVQRRLSRNEQNKASGMAITAFFLSRKQSRITRRKEVNSPKYRRSHPFASFQPGLCFPVRFQNELRVWNLYTIETGENTKDATQRSLTQSYSGLGKIFRLERVYPKCYATHLLSIHDAGNAAGAT